MEDGDKEEEDDDDEGGGGVAFWHTLPSFWLKNCCKAKLGSKIDLHHVTYIKRGHTIQLHLKPNKCYSSVATLKWK